MTGSSPRRAARGFTLIELLVVMLIIGTLLSIAVPRYFRTLEHARETVLRQDLAILREAIDKYYADRGEDPDTLVALADTRYVQLFAADAIRFAIAAYYAHGHRYPNTRQDLLVDNRSPVPVHYLRRLYIDPMTNGTEWQLVPAPEGGIKGVYSASTLAPIKRQNFAEIDKGFTDKDCYCAWQFVYEPRFRRRGAPGNPAPGNPASGDPAPGNQIGRAS